MASNRISMEIIRESDNARFNIGKDHLWWFLKNGLEGFGDIDNVIGYSDLNGQDGGIFDYDRLTQKNRTIKFCHMDPKNNENARRDALSFFNIKDTFKIYITHADRTLWASGKILKLASTISDDTERRLDFMITFKFADPYLKSADNFGRNIAAVTGMIAFPYMVRGDSHPMGLTGGVFNFAREVLIANDGTAPTKCIINIEATGEVENPAIFINDDYIRIIDELQVGDVINIDMTSIPLKVEKNGQNWLGHCDRTSSFTSMVINPGDNSIRFDADNGTPNMSVVVYYYKRYGAI